MKRISRIIKNSIEYVDLFLIKKIMFAWSPHEELKAEHWNSIAAQIEHDLIHNRATYENVYVRGHCIKDADGNFDHNWQPKDDFEKGVASSLGLIRHRVHCMNPS